jgi:NADH:ubiquinone oxidoreductase subunit 3 (subunit A)
MDNLLSPPIAFLVYIPLVLVIYWVGKMMAGPEKPSALKESSYSSGEEAHTPSAAPGYEPFFLIAFFFAILHLGVLILGTGDFTVKMIPYLAGLVFTLVVLLLG